MSPDPSESRTGPWPVACPVCAAPGPFDAYVLREMLFGSRETFEYRRCRDCGLLWLPAPPADPGRYYPPAYHHANERRPPPRLSGIKGRLHAAHAARVLFGGHRVGGRLGALLGPPLIDQVARIRWLVRAARLRSFDDPILDVGSGPAPERLGLFAAVGFRRLLGIDPFIDSDVEFEGVPVRRRTLDQVDGTFALISFNHSFEHLPNPRATMLEAARRLQPGGTLLIRTPIMGSWFWDEYGVAWWELDPPRHLFVHTQRSLEQLATEAGLRLDRVAYDSTFMEILASDQIRRDIAWREPASWWASPPGSFSEAAIGAARQTASELNATGRAGRGLFFFRRPTD